MPISSSFCLIKKKTILNCAYHAFSLTNFKGSKNPVSEKLQDSRLCPAPLALQLACLCSSFVPPKQSLLCIVPRTLCPCLSHSCLPSLLLSKVIKPAPWQIKTRKTNPPTNPAMREMRALLEVRVLRGHFSTLSCHFGGIRLEQTVTRFFKKEAGSCLPCSLEGSLWIGTSSCN